MPRKGQFIDLTGEKFGRLTAIQQNGYNKSKKITWECQCDCGESTIKSRGDLVSGKTKSCGCLRRELARKFIDITGQKFGRLTVLKRYGMRDDKITWMCKCDCGNEKEATGEALKSGQTKSCGCLSEENIKKLNVKHNLSRSPIYVVWRSMLRRCYDKKFKHYKNYGGRGISICEEWLNSKNGTVNFYNWAIENGYKKDLSIERINNNGNYEPSNCKWSTKSEQMRNTRRNHLITYKGNTQTLTDWAAELKISPLTLSHRINISHWPVERALTTPVRIKHEKHS